MTLDPVVTFPIITADRTSRGPSSHSIVSALLPCQADQLLVVQTATPPSCWNSGRPRYLGSETISTTPDSLRAAVASNDLTLPSTTGGCAITANNWFSWRATLLGQVSQFECRQRVVEHMRQQQCLRGWQVRMVRCTFCVLL